MLDYEKLDVYQCSIRFVANVIQIIHKIPKGNSQLIDQLRRAAFSVPLNIAEGSGKISPRDRARFHSIARLKFQAKMRVFKHVTDRNDRTKM